MKSTEINVRLCYVEETGYCSVHYLYAVAEEELVSKPHEDWSDCGQLCGICDYV